MPMLENTPGTRIEPISALFTKTFTASEGKGEGALIGALVRRLLSDTPQADIATFTVEREDTPIGAVIFSRMRYAEDPRVVFILSPMAVVPTEQGKGLGQALIQFGLERLRERGVDVVLTYGDPAFYGKMGFQVIDETVARAPLALSQPEGWLGQSLTASALSPLEGPAQCVDALNDPAYW